MQWQRLRNLARAFELPDVKRRILFLFAMFAVYVAGAHVPLPGIDREKLADFFQAGGLLEFLDAFAGGSLKRFSIFALGIMPYINASIIFQLLTMAIPSLEQMQREEGEYGRRKIAQWTRYLTVGLALLQGFGLVSMLRSTGAFVAEPIFVPMVVLTLTAGTSFLMWLGEQITDKGIGQGVSLIIFVGIMTRMPTDIAQTISQWRVGEVGFFNVFFLAAVFVGMVAFIVYIHQAQRKIPVQYAKRVKGMKVYGGSTSFLPLKVNQAGVIPIIFAVSVALFPATIARFIFTPTVVESLGGLPFLSSEGVQAAIFNIQQWTTPGDNWTATGFYFLLVILFTYFYTAATFNPEQIADNMRKSGGFIPGIRPGKPTKDYLDQIMYRITLVGALFLGVVAVSQYYIGPITGVRTFNLVGGTSLLIVVGVALDTMLQVEAHLLMRHYEGFIK
ncbi:MAG: preprotein translocase subunit SecY [Armatimonadota bacterium]|jgi:preprotein translocase subunit SecY